jgi:hypothetical protein
VRAPNPWAILAIIAALGGIYGVGRTHGAQSALEGIRVATERRNLELFKLADQTSIIAAALNKERAAHADLQKEFEHAANASVGANACAVDADSVQRVRDLWAARP